MKKISSLFLVIIFFGAPFFASAALTDSIQGYWNLDESSNGSGSVVRMDSTANNNDLTDNNTTASGSGIINNGADFESSSNEFLSIADAVQSGLDITGNISLSLWFKPESQPATDTSYVFVGKHVGGDGNYVFNYHDVSGVKKLSVSFYDNDAPGTNVNYTINQTLANGVWNHLVYTFNVTTGTATLYVNGTSIGAVVDTSVDQLNNSAAPFTMGDLGEVHFVDGIMDEVGIWSRELTPAEVTELYNGGVGLTYPFSASTITGSGTPNRLAKFITTNTIGDSLFSDDGSNITLSGGNLLLQPGSVLDVIAVGALNFGTAIATGINIGHTGATTTFLGPITAGEITLSQAKTTQNCAVSTSPANCGSASAGSVAMAVGSGSLVVNTTAVSANSQILITEDSSLGLRLGIICNAGTNRTYRVSARSANTSFTIKSSGNTVRNKACLNYWIIN